MPVAIAGFLCWAIYPAEGLVVELNKGGVNYFFELFKFPVIAQSSIPVLVGLVVSIHRSNQLFIQIKQGQDQNLFSNYYKHKEELHKLIEKLEIDCDLKFVNVGKLYVELFPYNSVNRVETRSTEIDSEKSKLEFIGKRIADWNQNISRHFSEKNERKIIAQFQHCTAQHV